MQFANAQFEGSVSEQQRVTKRRKAIDSELETHRKELGNLREQLDGLPDLVGERAGIKFGVDLGNGWSVGTDLRNELVQSLNGLNDSIAKAYGLLPSESECLIRDDTKRAAEEAFEQRRREIQHEQEEMAREREEKARLELWTKKPITENGYIVAFDIFDEYGVKVRRDEATVVTK